jgi:hypothetical protein
MTSDAPQPDALVPVVNVKDVAATVATVSLAGIHPKLSDTANPATTLFEVSVDEHELTDDEELVVVHVLGHV